MAAGSESKIDTGLFLSTADTVGTVAKELGACFEEWVTIARGLRGSWQGDSSDNVKNTVDAVRKSASDLLTALGGYRAALREIAGIYEKTEKGAEESGKSLKFDRAMR